EMPIIYPQYQSSLPFVPLEERLRNRIHFPDTGIAPPSTFKFWITVDLAYTIEWLKTLPFFHALRKCEQLRLVRNVTQAVAYLTAAFDSYTRLNSDVTIFPDGTMLCQRQKCREHSEEHNKWFGINTRLKSIGVDKREYVLLKAIISCDPDDYIFCAKSREMLQKERNRFAKCPS
ncbi:hypothetical protein PENTCL1PPCAC_4077, partial [Pristionchus entomophagus]